MIDELIAAAKAWRGLARLVVLVVTMESAAPQELVVKLGDSRRRWKRVAAAIAPMVDDIIGARGYDEGGELVGSWDAPDDDDPATEPAEPAEPAEHAAHRMHTQWVIREVAKVYEGALRLNIELVGATIEVVRALRGSVSTPVQQVPTEDEASKTLGLLLSSVMSNNNARSNDEAQRDEGSPGGDATGQGPQAEHPQAGS